MSLIYDIDTTKSYTAKDVRDAIVKCFTQVHNEIQELNREFAESLTVEEFEQFKKANVEQIVRRFFKETGGDFDNPTKGSIIAMLKKLSEFAAKFRSHNVTEDHYEKIMQLVAKL